MKRISDLQLEFLCEMKSRGYEYLSRKIIHQERRKKTVLEVDRKYLHRLVEGQNITAEIFRKNKTTIAVISVAVDIPESDEEVREINKKLGIDMPVSITEAEWLRGFDISEDGQIYDHVREGDDR